MANVNQMRRKFHFAAWIIGLSLGACTQALAAVTDLASVPLASSSSSVVRPNILFTLDDSGSMAWDYLPDYAGGRTYSGGTARHCKVSNTCGNGEVPFQTNEYNGMAYNPRITYQLPVNADGTTMASQVSPWTAVNVDGYNVQSTSTINLTNGYQEIVYCNGVCKKNGIDTNNPFLLRPSVGSPTDNSPVYALPGTLTSGTIILSTPHDGLLNQATTSFGAVFNGTLNVSTPAGTPVTLTGVAVSRSGSTVTVAYNAISPALATGDKVVVSNVSSNSCSSGYKSGGGSLTITRVDATHFTYTSTTGTIWTKTSCKIVATKSAVTAAPPSISKSGNTVTVTLASAPSPALATGNSVTVANGSGTCDAGYKATSVSMTRIGATSFSYILATAVGTASNTSCNITQVAITPPSPPGINLSGTTVTVYKTAHGLATGDLVSVSNGTTGNCDDGYTTIGSVLVTRLDANTFTYSPPIGSVITSSNCRIDKIAVGITTSYTSASTVSANPYYFVLIPTEYCDSIYLTKCVASTAEVTISGVDYKYPAPVRFCKDNATAALPPGNAGAQLSGTTINCQGKYSVGTGINFQSARYGLFWRGDIVPARTTYGNEMLPNPTIIQGTDWGSPLTYNNTLVIDRSSRADCAAAPNCTYAEEMTNFANWYAYYHTRLQMMKSSAGRAFLTLDNRYRVGFTTINPTASTYLPVAMFGATQKANWYTTFYSANTNGSTPLREALATAGRYFAGKKPGVMSDDPMEYACQQNFELLTTDGYWNGTSSNVKEIDGTTTMGNYDNVDSGMSKRVDGAYDGAVTDASNTLADAAMYYYKTDLRNSTLSNCTGASVGGAAGGDVCQDIVPMTPKDMAAGLGGTQHMTTFSLGLADGLMTYQPDYESASSGDFWKIKNSSSGCSFSGSGVCNWPLPVNDSQTALDDLWHAAVNGRGTYYNARDPGSLTAGLTGALAGINVRLAAAASSATSSPNITQTDRSIFSSTYRTSKWDGEVTAQMINAATGAVEPAIIWSAQTQLDNAIHADASASVSTRHIYTFDDANSSGDHLKDFLYGSLTATEQAFFDNKCTSLLLTQCTASKLSASEITSGNSGLNLVHYLRGNQSFETANATGYSVFRAREHLLGDTVNAKPAYVKMPQYGFTDAVTPNYASFKAAQQAIPRQGVLYMGGNDGMLHAFNSDTGAELWAYLPKIVMPNLYKLAEASYATLHQYYVDGSPETMDIFVDATASAANGLTPATGGWHTIIVGALGLGGRGFFALDVTDPSNPIALWEICSDSTLCAISDVDIGYSYGNPVITKRSSDGKWVVLVTSGYNNVSPGSGQGTLFELDAVTGAVLNKTSTGVATNPPSGLAKISAWFDRASSNLTARYVYSGDLNGDVWRFDLGAVGGTTATKIATLKNSLGVAQSVTTRPELGDPMNNTKNTLSGSGNPGIFVGTGRYLGATDVSNVQIQSIYGIKDDLSRTTAVAAYIGNPRSPQAGFSPFVRQYIYQPSGTTRSTSTYAVDWANNSGWYADFAVSDASNQLVVPSPSPGERVNLDPILVSSTLIVVTNVLETSACTIGGTSWIYYFDFKTGQYVSTEGNTIVGQKLGNALSVGIVIGSLADGTIKAWVTDAGGMKSNIDPTVRRNPQLQRSSWRELTP